MLKRDKGYLSQNFYILKDKTRLETFKTNARKEALKFDLHKIVPQYEIIYEDTLSKCSVL